ncbi:hypothetical protein U9M48_003347 [Paspalum notatum var. saurae]|uniref:Uncharacterized protein n=1 Tax=Paspalum notatum var. saurae TaxID=547442 RepID=A0AAQ3PLC5_PASNO
MSDRGSSSVGPREEEATSSNTGPVLLLDSQIQTCNQDEADLLRRLHTKPISLIRCFDEVLMTSTGWDNFAHVSEGGIVLLTKEFLMTVRVLSLQSDTTVHFKLFNSEHELTLRQFSNPLGFSPRCSIAAEPIGFNATEF